MNAYEKGYISEEDIDRALLRVLNAKFKIGLMDNPLVNKDEACRTVRCDAHKKLALEAARKSIVLLKNENILPLDKSRIKKLAVFGMGADVLPVGDNYSGPYKVKWTAEDAKTPLDYLREYLEGVAEVIFSDDSKIEEIAPLCDAAIYFTSLIEGEGMDRSDIRLPGVRQTVQKDDNAIIVGKTEFSVNTNQEESIKRMIHSNPHSAVVLLNGSPIDMSEWHDECNAIIEAWYPGEQGAQAICEILFGDICPSGKLPITIPRNIGQLPIFYSMKPSGRGYGYVENDGSPLYPFGYGLSYTSFDLSDLNYETDGNSINIKLKIKNMGNYDGAEVIQLYLTSKNCDVVRPIKELCAYKRVDVRKNDTQQISLVIPDEAFFYLDRNMVYDMHDGDYTVTVGTSSVDTIDTAEIKVRDKQIFITD
ncbi:MAG: glycoside hydrolase family 3 C-terminal domain-containing protein [Acutalibacteraceae bacterium]|nr:glycoside hydrolase family 3 C-terminal domain-containing protein [Acutalibacteraceae bacterium]